MAIRKRKPKNNDDETPKPLEVPSVPFEFSTWKEQACFVLDELEKSGVNIYDESRTPGMYLRRRNNNRTVPKKLVSVIKQVSESSSPSSQESQESTISSNLLNFFKSQK